MEQPSPFSIVRGWWQYEWILDWHELKGFAWLLPVLMALTLIFLVRISGGIAGTEGLWRLEQLFPWIQWMVWLISSWLFFLPRFALRRREYSWTVYILGGGTRLSLLASALYTGVFLLMLWGVSLVGIWLWLGMFPFSWERFGTTVLPGVGSVAWLETFFFRLLALVRGGFLLFGFFSVVFSLPVLMLVSMPEGHSGWQMWAGFCLVFSATMLLLPVVAGE